MKDENEKLEQFCPLIYHITKTLTLSEIYMILLRILINYIQYKWSKQLIWLVNIKTWWGKSSYPAIGGTFDFI